MPLRILLLSWFTSLTCFAAPPAVAVPIVKYNIEFCGVRTWSAPADPKSVKQICVVTIDKSELGTGMLVTLASGKELLYTARYYEPKNGILSLENVADGSQLQVYYILYQGEPLRVSPVRHWDYPFNRIFEVFFR